MKVLRAISSLLIQGNFKVSCLWEHPAGHRVSPLLVTATRDREPKALHKGWAPPHSFSGHLTLQSRTAQFRFDKKLRQERKGKGFMWLNWVWTPERLDLNINLTYFLPRMYFLPTEWSVNPPFYSPPFSETHKLLQVLSRDTIFTVPFAYVLLLPLKFVQSLETDLELCPYWKQLEPLSSSLSCYRMKIIPRTLWMRNESLASFLFLHFFPLLFFFLSLPSLAFYIPFQTSAYAYTSFWAHPDLLISYSIHAFHLTKTNAVKEQNAFFWDVM